MSYNVSAILDAALEGKPDSSVDAAIAGVAAQLSATATEAAADIAETPDVDLERPIDVAPEPIPEPAKEAPKPEEAAAESENPEATPETAGEPTPEPEPEPEPEADPRAELFAKLRAQFPHESYEATGKRVEAAFGTPEAAQDGPDALDEIAQDFKAALDDVTAAREAMRALEQDAEENGTTLEFNKHTRETYEAVKRAEDAAQATFDQLQQEAFEAVENHYPELKDENGVAKRLYDAKLTAAYAANPDFGKTDPTYAARLAVQAALEAKAFPSVAPVPQAPKPAPARKQAPASHVPTTALPSGVQGHHAQVGAPANGQPPPPSLAQLLTAPGASLQALAAKQFGGGPSLDGIF